MSRLTWQNVAAPDFSAAAQTQAYAAEAFDKAMGRVSGSITAFDNNRKDMADAGVMRNMMQYQDAGELQKAIASGALMNGVNPDHVRAEALLNAQKQAGNLLGLDKTRQEVATAQQTYDHNAEMNPGRVHRQTLDNNGLALDQSNKITDRSRADLERANQEEAARRIFDLVRGGQVDTVPGQNAYFQGLDSSNPVDMLIAKQMAAWRPDLVTPTTVGGAATPAAGAPMGGVVAPGSATPVAASTGAAGGWSTTVGNLVQADLPNMTIGQWADTVAPELIRQTKGTAIMNPGVRDEGSSASGRYQITKRTLESIAPTVLGADWRNAKLDEKTQNALGKHLYDSRVTGKSSMVSEWDGLKNIKGADAKDAWAGIPWDVAKEIIAQFESGSTKILGANPTMEDVRAYARGAATSTLTEQVHSAVAKDTNVLSNSLAGGPNAQRFLKAAADSSSLLDTAKTMADKTGMASGYISQKLADVMREAKVSAPVAAEILSEAATNDGWIFNTWGKKEFENGAVVGAIDKYKANNALQLKNALTNDHLTQRDNEQLAESQKKVDAAKKLVTDLQARVDMAEGTPRAAILTKELDAATVRHQRLLGNQNELNTTVRARGNAIITQNTDAPAKKEEPANAAEQATRATPNMAGVSSRAGAYAQLQGGQVPTPATPVALPPVIRPPVAETPVPVPAELAKLTPDSIKKMGREEVRKLITDGRLMRSMSNAQRSALMLQFSSASN